MNLLENEKLLGISSRDELANFLKTDTISWGNLSKIRKNKDLSAPIFDLLDKEIGKTLGEKAYRCVNGNPKCLTCKTENVHFYNWKRGFSKFCGKTCQSHNKELNDLSLVKRERTMMERYGAKSSMESLELRTKIEKTNIKRFGNRSPLANLSIKDKALDTMIERYGVKVPYKNPNIAKHGGESKRLSTVTKLTNNVNYECLTENYDHNLPVQWRCKKCNSIFTHTLSEVQRPPICRKCYPMIKGTSKFETEILKFLELNNVSNISSNIRFQKKDSGYFELDIFLPDKNIGIEYNGLYWHSELAGKNRNYHSEKYNFFKDRGIKLISIFEHKWLNKRDICESMLMHKLGLTNQTIFARKCSIVDVVRDEANKFIDTNHISGNSLFSTAIGLKYNNEIVAIATFRKDRFSANKSAFELIRFCTKRGISVVGGLDKLISNFQKRVNADIKTFCDLTWGDGNGYLKSGFKLIKTLPPCCWYFDKHGTVSHRSKFQKKTLLKMLSLEESTKTEWQLARELNLNRFWDCGNLSFIKKFDEEKEHG